jgi:hypothetical protein
MERVAPHGKAAPIVAQATGAFTGTLTGSYSNINAPGFANVLSYATSGTLTGVGSTHLRGSLFVRGGGHPGRRIGQLLLRNTGGAMNVSVFQTATAGIDTYQVARARGSDAAFLGASGELTITRSQTINVPFYSSGQVTMTFT